MRRFTKILLAATVALLAGVLLAGITHAQRPPELNRDGAAYMRVNINPTDVPPMVNINPYQTVPRVEVAQMPELKIAPTGCEARQNYVTAIGRSISGPLMITYLNLPQPVTATLVAGRGRQSVNLEREGHLGTALFLASNQTLEFDSSVLYSGCRPN